MIGVSEELFAFRTGPYWAEHGTPGIVSTVQQDRQQQSVVDPVEIEEWSPSAAAKFYGGQEPHAPGASQNRTIVGSLKDRCITVRRRGQPVADRIEACRDRHNRSSLRGSCYADIAVWSQHMVHPFVWVHRARADYGRGEIAVEHRDAVHQWGRIQMVDPIFQLFERHRLGCTPAPSGL